MEIDPLVLERYRSVGITLDDTLRLSELNEPIRYQLRHPSSSYSRWRSDVRLAEWIKLLFDLAEENNPNRRRVSLLIGAAAGEIYDSAHPFPRLYRKERWAMRPGSGTGRYLDLANLRSLTPMFLVCMAINSEWRIVNKLEAAETLLYIFKP